MTRDSGHFRWGMRNILNGALAQDRDNSFTVVWLKKKRIATS